MSEREDFYDREIAPALMELAGKCEANGLSLVASVEWEPGEGGTTATLQAGSSFNIRLVHTATKARGNIDSLFMAVENYAREHGHSSIYLNLLKVPLKPGTHGQSQGE